MFAAFGLNHNRAPQHFTAKVEKGEIHDVVEATGMINSVITVQVGSQVSGTISKLYVDFNSRVHKGDIVALIDPALLNGALLQAKADLENAKANLVAARANLEKAKSGLAVFCARVCVIDAAQNRLFPGLSRAHAESVNRSGQTLFAALPRS